MCLDFCVRYHSQKEIGFSNYLKPKSFTIVITSYSIHYTKLYEADGNMLKTILRNLLSNAIKHTHQGGEIIIDSNYDTKGNLWFSVSDNGVGMHPDITLSLFNNTDKYTSLGTANEIGSGFGLVLCKELIDKHGGKIEVVSHENIGSTFTVTLPAKQETHQHLNTCLETN